MPELPYTFPSCEETMQHPAFGSALWALEPHSSGKAAVAKGRGGPIHIHWEMHGSGPIRMLLVMGLGGSLTAWQNQTLHFGHTHGERHTVLVLDNRGAGLSDAPLARYTTREMARDALELLDHVGWTDERGVNLVGISLGGMIAQELACLAPRRIRSLSLLCTSAQVRGRGDLNVAQSAWERVKLFRPKSEEQSIRDTASAIFVPEFLAAEDALVLPSRGTTPRCGPAGTEDGEYGRFASNYQRFQAQTLLARHGAGGVGSTAAPASRTGFFCQLLAAAGHSKTPGELARMADEVGRERILVLHGRRDNMIAVENGERLIAALEPGVGLIVQDMGHAPIFERSAWLNQLLEERLRTWAEL